jgi:hypothetical protein
MALQPLLSAIVDSVDLDELAEAPKGDSRIRFILQ